MKQLSLILLGLMIASQAWAVSVTLNYDTEQANKIKSVIDTFYPIPETCTEPEGEEEPVCTPDRTYQQQFKIMVNDLLRNMYSRIAERAYRDAYQPDGADLVS